MESSTTPYLRLQNDEDDHYVDNVVLKVNEAYQKSVKSLPWDAHTPHSEASTTAPSPQQKPLDYDKIVVHGDGYDDDDEDDSHVSSTGFRCFFCCCCLQCGDAPCKKYLGCRSDRHRDGVYRQISSLLQKFLRGSEDVHLHDIALGVALVRATQKLTPHMVQCDDLNVGSSWIRSARYYSKFMIGSYGWQLYTLMHPITGLIKSCLCRVDSSSSAYQNAFLRVTRLPPKDLIVSCTQSEVFRPAHFLCVDHRSRCLVVVVRGSLEPNDFLTDAVCGHGEFMGGSAHLGIVHAAKWLHEKLNPFIESTRRDWPEYGLVIVGHSLGAAAAALLAMLLKPVWSKLHCFAYSCPLLVDELLAEECRPYVTSIVLNKDIVPRLSLHSMESLRGSIVKVTESSAHLAKKMQLLVHAVFSHPKKILEKASKYGIDLAAASDKFESETLFGGARPLFLPGTIVYLLRQKRERRCCTMFGKKVHHKIVRPDRSVFNEICISKRMLLDHLPNVLDDVLQELETEIVRQDSSPLQPLDVAIHAMFESSKTVLVQRSLDSPLGSLFPSHVV
eukprot:GILK01008682.1.p1 GENE.GILK01008682.1~~GILK01008682.1.p1  ORF type:complete len:581 (-),score=96.90 GILK01008682.1:98-1774(-)